MLTLLNISNNLGSMDTFSPTAEEIELLERYVLTSSGGPSPQIPKLVLSDGTALELSAQMAKIFGLIAQDFSAGRSISIISHHTKLTTQEAADFLGLSRPTLIKLLTQYLIPFETIGRHRKINFSDVQALQEKLASAQRDAITKMRELSDIELDSEESLANNPLIRD